MQKIDGITNIYAYAKVQCCHSKCYEKYSYEYGLLNKKYRTIQDLSVHIKEIISHDKTWGIRLKMNRNRSAANTFNGIPRDDNLKNFGRVTAFDFCQKRC